MNFKSVLKPLSELSVLALVAYVVHQIFLHLYGGDYVGSFYYSTTLLYTYFYFASAIIIVVLVKVREKNIDSVGHAFMLLTCIKMVFAYILLYPILDSVGPFVAAEKTNFLLIFLLFLILETIITSRLLNK